MAHITGTTAKDVPLVADPKTLAGQKIGAILSVKHLPARNTTLNPADQRASYHVAVWDHIKIEKFQVGEFHDVEGTNLRTGKKVKLMSRLSTCFCVIEDPKLYYEYKNLSKDSSHIIRDPATVEGQQHGAILVVKSKPSPWSVNQWDDEGRDCYEFFSDYSNKVDVGDCVEFISGYPDNSEVIKGRNLKTGSEVKVSWKSFFPEDKNM